MITLIASSLTALAADPSGIWKFKVEAANGRSADATLTLHWENDRLSGTIENRAGKVDITNASFSDDQIAFTVVREVGRRLRKKKFTINYAGTLKDDTISGTISTTGRDKKPVTIPWEATRSK